MRNSYLKINKFNKKGFTLVELLVVMAIVGVLVSIVAGGFRSSQMRGRDAQRKSDLKQLASSVELYYSDYSKYPDSLNGQLVGCLGSACTWGSGEFTDGRTTYFRVMPKDPVNANNYYYRIVDSPTNQKFQIFAHLENTEDKDLITTSYSCGAASTCNFSVTSPNTTPSE